MNPAAISNVHHLTRLLPGWDLRHARLPESLAEADAAPDWPRHWIMTMSYAATHEIQMELVVRADGCAGPLALPGFPGREMMAAGGRAVVIDLMDSEDRAEEAVRVRRRDYRMRGWRVDRGPDEWPGTLLPLKAFGLADLDVDEEDQSAEGHGSVQVTGTGEPGVLVNDELPETDSLDAAGSPSLPMTGTSADLHDSHDDSDLAFSPVDLGQVVTQDPLPDHSEEIPGIINPESRSEVSSFPSQLRPDPSGPESMPQRGSGTEIPDVSVASALVAGFSSMRTVGGSTRSPDAA
ncbi:MAG: hypothetical protein ACHRHE_04525 [Tepidisphaerales bacterium]